MEKKYKILPDGNGKFKLEFDNQIVKLCRTDIDMETDKPELLKIIAEELDPEQYQLEDGDIHGQYVPFYYFLSKVLMAEMDDEEGFFNDEHFHWMISCDPFFHLNPGPESASQYGYIDFAIKKLEEAGGRHEDLPLLMAFDEETMTERREDPDYYVDIETAEIIRGYFVKLPSVRKGLFYQLWSETGWSVWIPLLWLNDLCEDDQFSTGIISLQNLTPDFGVTIQEFKEEIKHYKILLDNCRDFLSYY